MKLVFATANKHKLQEAREILGEFEVISPLDLGFSADIEETGETLEENSILKAQTIYNQIDGFSCFADDTGLEVEALDGGPGVYTARYAGENASFEDNMDKLLAELNGLTNRKARFRTVVTLIISQILIQFEGIVDGRIATEKSGKGGFGYDPVFIPDYLPGGVKNTDNLTLADISEEDKNLISHRGLALKEMKKYLNNYVKEKEN